MIDHPQEDSNLDDLINQIKHQHNNKEKKSMDTSNYQSNSTDNLLEQFKSELKQQQHSDQNQPKINENLQQFKQQLEQEHNLVQKRPAVNENLQEIKQQLQQKQEENLVQHSLERNQPKINENLQQFKQQLQQKQEEKIETITHQNQEEIRYTEQRKQQQQKLLIRQAEQWLKSLDEYSDEGLWFESFSHNYPSRLEAAIDYLAVLNASS